MTISLRRPALAGTVALLVALCLDQISKRLVEAIGPDGEIEVTNFFYLVLIRNTGTSFSLLEDAGETGQSVLAIGALAIIAGLVIWMLRTPQLWLSVGLGLIAGGALGNALDRLRHGAVTDFIDIHVAGWPLPTFNLADLAIWVGAALLFVPARREKIKEQLRN